MSEKTLAQLIDELITCNVKVYHLVDIIENEDDNDKVAMAARKAQQLNRTRSTLVNSIDLKLEGKESSIKV